MPEVGGRAFCWTFFGMSNSKACFAAYDCISRSYVSIGLVKEDEQ